MEDCKALKDALEKLPPQEQEDVFYILLKHNVKYSRNSNGIFINMTTFPPNIRLELDNYINTHQNVVTHSKATSYDRKQDSNLRFQNTDLLFSIFNNIFQASEIRGTLKLNKAESKIVEAFQSSFYENKKSKNPSKCKYTRAVKKYQKLPDYEKILDSF